MDLISLRKDWVQTAIDRVHKVLENTVGPLEYLKSP